MKVSIPEDCIVIQLGEMVQYFSGDYLRPTPYCVRSKGVGIEREQIAIFMDSPYDLHLFIFIFLFG